MTNEDVTLGGGLSYAGIELWDNSADKASDVCYASRSGPGRRRARVKLQDFRRYPLTFGPSPVHRLDRLTQHLGGASVWAKREDCNSGLAFGGNKIRKL